jgi:hypothetical protein
MSGRRGGMRVRRRGHLFYDSARAGAQSGVRGIGTEDRTLIFIADDLSVDVMVHAGPDDYRYYFGQILDEKMRIPLPGLEVALGDDPDETTLTNDLGEFTVSSIRSVPEHVLTVRTESLEVLCRIPPDPRGE